MSTQGNTYLDREIDEKFKDIMSALDRIEAQTIKHNGRLTKTERGLIALACMVLGVALGRPELIQVLLKTFFF